MAFRDPYPEFAGRECIVEPDGQRVDAAPLLWAELAHLRRYTRRRAKEREARRARRHGLRLPTELIVR
jgi:hypothetical protein